MGISIVQAALLKLERAHLKEHGTFADPELDHGDARAYAIGCRCIICVNGHKGRQRKEREDRKEYLARTGEFKPNVRGSSVKHGEYSGYLYGCRCNPCLLAGAWATVPISFFLSWMMVGIFSVWISCAVT